MKFVMCPKCGKKLCKAEPGTKVEIECPKCGEFASVVVDEDSMHISKKQTPDKPVPQRA
ncbi:MAG: Com family DNA-binding transcriptional regulator [Clostridiales bacterium]|nr:Com family DNA-binding transcriptional regulator [Clostridiales bacterium]